MKNASEYMKDHIFVLRLSIMPSCFSPQFKVFQNNVETRHVYIVKWNAFLNNLRILLLTSQPSEDARLVRRQHYRAARKYCVGGKNRE